ncbi:hypothetical protein [Synechococcus sp. LA31]|uniref:ribonuclease toxin HepT-like protein n=1 Tax=Synechococcus sp. LA31 TaxID=2741953 RepID=UPI001BDD3C28|nr:hypothetical protein [Synechococcus sp. LA31]QVV66902.1 hypothetical protein KJJ24_10530 [Synechococcus sp. LA31]
MASLPSDRRLADLCLDLQVERSKLSALVLSLANLQRDWDVAEAAEERSDAAALRLQSLYTGIERCFVQIVRVLNGAPPDGADWHRRLLERMGVSTELRPALLDASTVAGLAELMRFRHVVRHLYAYELERDQVLRLLQRALELWPVVDSQLVSFEAWLTELSS